MKLNRIYYKHLFKSLIVVIIGLGILIKEMYPSGPVSDNYFILMMVILASFAGFLGVLVLFFRFENGPKFRRKFVYCFFGVANVCIGIISIPFSILRKAGILSIMIYVTAFLVGVAILLDIFFGKRASKNYEREVLIN